MLNPWTVRVTQTQANNLSTDIKTVGTAIRDWITPFYTLGGVTTFVITVLTLIDSSGWLVRAITATLMVLTIAACAKAWSRARAKPAADASAATGPKLHTALLIISLFFCVGLLVSEALMHEKRKGASATDAPRTEVPAEAAPTTTPAPTTPATPAPAPTLAAVQEATPTPAKTAVTEPAAPAQATPAAPAAPAASTPPSADIDKNKAPAPTSSAPAAIKTEAPTKPAKPATAKPAPTAPSHQDSAAVTPPAEAAHPKPAKAPSAAVVPARCSEIMLQFSAGRSLSDSDKHYLETSCR